MWISSLACHYTYCISVLRTGVESRNALEIVARISELAVALWFPCVLWNCFRFVHVHTGVCTTEYHGTTEYQSELLSSICSGFNFNRI